MISRFLLISHFLRPIVSKMRAVGLVDGCGQCHHMLSYSMVVGGPVMIHADGREMFSWADVVINMLAPLYEDNGSDEDITS